MTVLTPFPGAPSRHASDPVADRAPASGGSTSDVAPPPRLLFSTAPFFRRPVREAFDAAARSGFGGVEVMVTQDPNTQEPERLDALALEFDLRVEAIHAPFLIFTKFVWGTDPVGKIRRSLALAAAVGAPTVIAHPPFVWQRAYREWLIDPSGMAALAAAEPTVTLTLENMASAVGVGLHGAHRSEHFARFPHFTLDTSHAGVAGVDLHEVAATHRDRLRHIHLSNNRGHGWDSHAPVDQGILAIGEFLEQLSDPPCATESNPAGHGGFTGSISLELDLRRWMSNPDALRDELSRNRRFCERRLPALR